MKTAKEIQRQVQQELYKRHANEETASRTPPIENETQAKNSRDGSAARKRSSSVDSSKFLSPKRKARSTTPEQIWNKDTSIFEAA